MIVVNIAEQRLQLYVDDVVAMDVAIATARNGVGEQAGSERTPRGWHQVRAMIAITLCLMPCLLGVETRVRFIRLVCGKNFRIVTGY